LEVKAEVASAVDPVVIVGGGNAGLCAAIAAAEAGAHSVLVDWAPEGRAGGNTYYAGGTLRCAHQGRADLESVIGDILELEPDLDVLPYSEQDYFGDIAKLSQYRSDPDLVMAFVRESMPTVRWLKSYGVRFDINYKHVVRANGRGWITGGSIIKYLGGGQGAIDQLTKVAVRVGVEFRHGMRMTRIVQDPSSRVCGVEVAVAGQSSILPAAAVVLACGGFEGNPAMRAQYLGPGWDLARVRGTEFNKGDGHLAALAVGADAVGNWSGCHAVAWDINAPMLRERSFAHGYERESYPYGIIVNTAGERFVDEGKDFYPYTYAMYGRAVLAQPGSVAYQIFDSKVAELIGDDYRLPRATRVQADTVAALARGLEIDEVALTRTVDAFNRSVNADVAFDYAVRDGRYADVVPRKSNWAQAIDAPPYLGFPVTCGITFTFGGLRIDTAARVLDGERRPLSGLFAAGEIVGGLYYHNYPGGSGLMAGAAFGKVAGHEAAMLAAARAAL
jgi:tricarballylate dehydrogenase